MKLTRSGRLVRRALHIALAAVLVYYIAPDIMFYVGSVPIHKNVVLFFLWCVPLSVEVSRLWLRKLIPYLMHEYERKRVASYFWFATGAVLLIYLFPQEIAAPCITATAICDPIIGETRRFRRRFAFSIGFLTCLLIFIIFRYHLLLAIFSASIVFIAESLDIEIHWGLREDLFMSRSKRKVSKYKQWFDIVFKADDDFMMQVIPAIILLVTFVCCQYIGLTWLLPQPIF
jgi:dolichol kinase